MAREYRKDDYAGDLLRRRRNIGQIATGSFAIALVCSFVWVSEHTTVNYGLFVWGFLPAICLTALVLSEGRNWWLERERRTESQRRGGKPVLGRPPVRSAFGLAMDDARRRGKLMLDCYLVGFEVETGQPLWISEEDLCSHACVFAKTGVGKTLWLEGLMFQQMARGRASGFTFIDAKRDPGTLADIILMALVTGRIEDLVVIDPFDPVCSYNFVFTSQRPDVKARKVLRCGLPPIGDDSPAKHYDRLAADAVSRLVRALESFGLAWSVKDIAVALSAFNLAYPRLRSLLVERGNPEAVIELGHLASTYRTSKGGFDVGKITENLRGIASELHSISNSEAGAMFCAPRADLSLTDAIVRGKLIYYMLPRLEEAESADRMVKVFREDLEVSIGEITSNRNYRLEDPHMVIIDEGASTFGPTWANLFELARKGRFALLFGAQSVSGLMDKHMGLSEEFYQRVIANVNLKVIMRLGDNKTAEDMCEWIGKIVTTKRTIGVAGSVGYNAHELTKHIEINRMSSDTFRTAVNLADNEDDLVSAEELKHEMSAEKGLAWFDIGDGRLRKGRSIWFDSSIPRAWDGRECLVRYEAVEGDEIGLADWVDEHILSLEKADYNREAERGNSSAGETTRSPKPDISPPPPTGETGDSPAAAKGAFRINLGRASVGRLKARVAVFGKKDPENPVEIAGEAAKKNEEPLKQNEPENTGKGALQLISKAAPKVAELAQPTPARKEIPQVELAKVEVVKETILPLAGSSDLASRPASSQRNTIVGLEPAEKDNNAFQLKGARKRKRRR